MLPEQELLLLINNFALIPAEIVKGNNLLTLITSMFMHASIGHIFGNMIFLHIFGDNLEDRLGHGKFLLYYLVCGFGASFLQILINPISTIPNLGASGAIAGAMGGYLLLFPRHRVEVLFSIGLVFKKAMVPAYTMLIYWFAAQLLTGVGSLAYLDQSMGGVAYFAHVGGFVTGFLLLLPFKRRLLVG
jgi:membrane associated rhomboid family serine protease